MLTFTYSPNTILKKKKNKIAKESFTKQKKEELRVDEEEIKVEQSDGDEAAKPQKGKEDGKIRITFFLNSTKLIRNQKEKRKY